MVCYPEGPKTGVEAGCAAAPGGGLANMSWWPGWNSIEGAAKWGDIFFWAGFALLVLLAGCEVLSKVYGWRKDNLVALRDEMTVLAQDVHARQAEQAHPEAPRAAVPAPDEAEIPATRLAEAQPEKAAPPPLPRESEPTPRTNEQVARLTERSPRGLTEAQKKAIVGILAQFRGQKFSVICIAGDPESKSIGDQIASVLRAAGWQLPEGGIAEATYNKEPVGLSLMVNAAQITTPSVLRPVAMLVKAFADAGLMQRDGALADPNIPRDQIEVRVGRNRGPT